MLPKGKGTDHVGIGRCQRHGGRMPNHVAAANRVKTEQLVQTYGARTDVAADEALEELVQRTHGHMICLAAVIASSEQIESVSPTIFERYDFERTLLGRLTKDSMSLGIAERQQKVNDAMGLLLAGVVRNVVGDLIAALTAEGVSVDVLVRIQRDQVPEIARRRLLEGGGGDAA